MTKLAAIRDAAREYAASFDASRITCTDAAALAREAAQLEAIAASVKARAAARAAESERWKALGAQSPAHLLARETGTSVGQAKQTLATGAALGELPALAAAAADGSLSAAQQSAIADGASANPRAERRLVELAQRQSLGELRDEVAKVKAAAEPDLEARRQRIHDARGWREYTDSDGALNIHLKGNPEHLVVLRTGIQAERRRLFDEARRAGRTERADALDLDALVATVNAANAAPATRSRGRSRGVDTKTIVRVDYESLVRGRPVEGEVCEIAGMPISVKAVEEIVAEGGFLAVVLTKAEKVTGVAHIGRYLPAPQRTAYEWSAAKCANEGCNRSRRLQRDHPYGKEFRRTGVTGSDDLDPLCDPCHDLRTTGGWALATGTGRRPLVPPDHPRHPQWHQKTVTA